MVDQLYYVMLMVTISILYFLYRDVLCDVAQSPFEAEAMTDGGTDDSVRASGDTSSKSSDSGVNNTSSIAPYRNLIQDSDVSDALESGTPQDITIERTDLTNKKTIYKGTYGDVPVYMYDDSDVQSVEEWHQPYGGIYVPNSKTYWKKTNGVCDTS